MEFRVASEEYVKTVRQLSCKAIHLIEEALRIPVGTMALDLVAAFGSETKTTIFRHAPFAVYELPGDRFELVKHSPSQNDGRGQRRGAHKDHSG